jgi:hypothetical protein
MPTTEENLNPGDPPEEDKTAAKQQEIDYQMLAEELMDMLKQDLTIENERRGRMPRF